MQQKLSFDEVLRIAAFIPSYREGVGQGLLLFFRDGSTIWVEQGIKQFTRRLARLFAINLQEARLKFGAITGQVNLTPLVLSAFLIFLPIRVLSPRVSGDPAYGYFLLRSIIDVRPEPKPCTLELEGGHSLTTRQSLRTVRSRLRAVRRLEKIMLDEYARSINSCLQFSSPETGPLLFYCKKICLRIWQPSQAGPIKNQQINKHGMDAK